MVILFGAYLDYFSLTNQSREVTCDFDFASGAGDDCDGWNSDDRDFLKIIIIIITISLSSVSRKNCFSKLLR